MGNPICHLWSLSPSNGGAGRDREALSLARSLTLPSRAPRPAGTEQKRAVGAVESRRAPARDEDLESAGAGACTAFDTDPLLWRAGQAQAEGGRVDPQRPRRLRSDARVDEPIAEAEIDGDAGVVEHEPMQRGAERHAEKAQRVVAAVRKAAREAEADIETRAQRSQRDAEPHVVRPTCADAADGIERRVTKQRTAGGEVVSFPPSQLGFGAIQRHAQTRIWAFATRGRENEIDCRRLLQESAIHSETQRERVNALHRKRTSPALLAVQRETELTHTLVARQSGARREQCTAHGDLGSCLGLHAHLEPCAHG